MIRHPETDWNEQKRYLSRSDRGFTARGEEELAALVEAMQGVEADRIVSTGLQRTDAVAARLADSREKVQLTVDKRWRECDHGHWEGMTFDEVAEAYPEQAKGRFDGFLTSRVHGGECLAEVWERVREAWGELSAATTGPVLVVTHATPIQLILCAQSGTPIEEYWRFQIDHGSVTRLDAGPDGLQLRQLNHCP